jgi:hypothetical protein
MSISTIRVSITDATHQLIKSKAEYPFNETGRRQKDGNWDVPLSFELYEKLKALQFPGETMNDTMFRLASTRATKLS